MFKKSLSKYISLILAISIAFTLAVPAFAESAEDPVDPQVSAASEFESEVLRLINAEREEAGLSALATSDKLAEIADVRAEESATLFSHSRPDGTKCFTVFAQFSLKYNFAGENLAYGYQTPEEVVAAWMDSPSHKANILSTRYTYVGIGYYLNADGTIYCSEMFCTPKLTFRGLSSD